jgi:transcriptional regulator with GAF, ATPase, and Fis domain
MAALRFIPLHVPADAHCARLSREVSAELERCTAWRSSDGKFSVMVACVSRALDLARIKEELARAASASARTIVVCDEQQSDSVRELLALGAGAVIEECDAVAAVIAARLNRWAQIDAAIAQPMVAENLVGSSEAWCACLRSVAESALFSAAPLLLTGATGTGKELLARMLHSLDPRPRKGDLMVVDCTTLTRELAASELFGHERGAFTGASGERTGAIAHADGGTLFLDEVGELSPELQAQFLRVLQEKAYRRVGSSSWHRVDFRLVCATNRDLPGDVATGRFRADLYHRIAAITCRTPALSERRPDIPRLAQHFAAGASLSRALLGYLASRSYGGNVRELQQLVQSCLRRHTGVGSLSLSCLPDDEIRRWQIEFDGSATSSGTWRQAQVDDFVRLALRANVHLKDLGRLVEAAAVRVAIAESDSITAAAQRLGITPRALHLRRAAERDTRA